MICFSNEGAWAKTIMQSLDVFIQTSFKLAHNPALSSVFFPQNKPSECLTPHFCHLLCISFNFLLTVSFINVLVSVWLLNSWTELNFEKDLQPVALFLTSQSVSDSIQPQVQVCILYTLHPPTLRLSYSRPCTLDTLRSHMLNCLCKCSFSAASRTRPSTFAAVHQIKAWLNASTGQEHSAFLCPKTEKTLVWLVAKSLLISKFNKRISFRLFDLLVNCATLLWFENEEAAVLSDGIMRMIHRRAQRQTTCYSQLVEVW